ncbi:MAG: hypothetical protein R3292_09335 [Alcanivorax sp.]|nr:hypothetical protein [Alcanivorax sp.]
MESLSVFLKNRGPLVVFGFLIRKAIELCCAIKRLTLNVTGNGAGFKLRVGFGLNAVSGNAFRA